MKTLVLVRHAKSSWKDASLADIDRPLNKRGKRDAPVMASTFADRDIDIELVICSPSKRTRRTAKIFCGEIGYQWHHVSVDKRIYEASATEILAVIKRIDDGIDSVMVFGHNPGLTDVVNRFAPYEIANIPTCGIATMEFAETRWKKLIKAQPVDFDFDYPKKHQDKG